jgi:hypothetical protein
MAMKVSKETHRSYSVSSWGGEPALAVAGGQIIDMGLKFRIGFERQNSPGRLGCQAIAKPRDKTVKNQSRFRVFHTV